MPFVTVAVTVAVLPVKSDWLGGLSTIPEAGIGQSSPAESPSGLNGCASIRSKTCFRWARSAGPSEVPFQVNQKSSPS